MSLENEIKKHGKKRKKEILKEVDKLFPQFPTEKPFTPRLYKVSPIHYQVQLSKNMVFDGEINKDGTVNFSVVNTDFKKVKLGKRISTTELTDKPSLPKFDPTWIDTFMSGLKYMDDKIKSDYKKQLKKKNNGKRKK